MQHDRYIKFILTVIALELLWLGAQQAGDACVGADRPNARDRHGRRDREG